MDERGKWREGGRREERRRGVGKRMEEREREKKVKFIKGESHSHSSC